MARKIAAHSDNEQIKDQVFSELQALIEESERLLQDSAALVGTRPIRYGHRSPSSCAKHARPRIPCEARHSLR